MNGMDAIDGSGTIDPANLSNSVSVALPAHSHAIASPRGIKRSRTPEHGGNGHAEGDQDDEEQSRRKRGRPPKTPRASSSEQPLANTPIQTPQMQARPLPQATAGSPPLASPDNKSTPTKTLVKALPTVRDHTSDQLNEEGDEYIPKEFDEAGETKADPMGYPQGGREYKCRTFRVPLRGTKLFMLATECARVLNYRDSYLLFNKNRSLHKIIASQIEKDDLIQQDILPYSYRSRQIAIVSARSMFRQFGSRVIVNGRRVRDDYWESKARKQGFTEDDLAGEKRPGAAKARDGSISEPATNLLPALPHNDVVYSSTIEPLPHGLSLDTGDTSASLAPLPMIHMATTDDPRLRDYTAMPRARQEMTGQPYHDRTQTSSAADLINQAQHTSDFNKMLSIQRNFRQKGLDEFYSKPREAPVSEDQSSTTLDSGLSVSQPVQVSQIAPVGMPNPAHHTQHMLPQQVPMQPNQMMAAQPNYAQQVHAQSVGQSPLRVPPNMQPNLMQQRSNPSMAGGGMGQASPYGYPSQQQQIWGRRRRSHSLPRCLHRATRALMSAPPQQSPSPLGHHPQQQQQQHHHQSPRNQQRQSIPQMPQQFSQMQHPQAAQPQGMQGMGYPGGTPAGYPGMQRAMYPPNQAPVGQGFMGGNPQQGGLAMNMGGGGMPGWPAGPGGQMQPGQPQSGQSGSPLGGGWSY
ncbi:Chromatin-remodelling complex RSC SWI/SNF subunit Rsc7/Swp82 [Penicillium paradoxum]|uniref:Chromatin-remodelling complex RSC SWI/SNF subunit Rsc7/Swp82 n=1 Tax=Penicillium paradoxum TaxID=176176 RepID=UPI0025479B3C|nr:Chromatin-remodelling complex RSC SWI/SNF subunit Rsc7/Swp82 [Penicillium paradoxum]KAJ5794120.1 Chromatin-remodelling complex RSC SWI/SNF subunit Rsc7/Swp82 [Penicillium paradoxum]